MKLTREHIFGDWTDEVIELKMPLTTTTRVRDLDSMEVSTTRRQTTRLADQQVKSLCDSCNTVWGAGLEARVGSVLTPMIRDELRLVTPDESNDLAVWAIKSTVMRDRQHAAPHQYMPPQAGLWLREHGTPPPGYVVWLSRSLVRFKQGHYTRSRLLHGTLFPRGTEPAVSDAPEHTFSTLVIGAVILVVVRADSRHQRDVSSAVPGFFVRLWPKVESFRWPIPEGFTVDEIDQVSGDPRLFIDLG